MSWIGRLIAGGAGDLVGQIGGVIDNLHTSQEEKDAAKLAVLKLQETNDLAIEETIRAELGAKERILVAELTQGDKFTKRARPSVVYFGLLAIAFNYSIAPAVGWGVFDLPTEFWVAWGGIVSTWSIGRSAEKRGSRSKAVQAITGSRILGD